ncbi:MAG: hypothetical protein IT184_07365 [Acidobacteria bacterium]|nr:hypothetical protein [Acidobacteriota bacterium]
MRRVLPVLVAVSSALALYAQMPAGPPTFDPADTEGLVVTRNPRIRYAWKRKTFWQTTVEPPVMRSPRVSAHTAAERQQMMAPLDALTALLKATPTGSAGEGFWVLDARTLDYFDVFALPAGTPLASYPLQFSAGLYPFHHEDIQNANGTWRTSVRGETEGLYFKFNQLPHAITGLPQGLAGAAMRGDQAPIAAEPSTGDRSPIELYLRPRETARFSGWPIYEMATLVVSRAGRDPWAPVALGRALAALRPAIEKDRKTAEDRLAGLKKKAEEVLSPAWEQGMRDRFEKTNGALRTERPSNYEARLRSLEHEIATTRTQATAEANPARDAAGAWYWNPVDTAVALTRRIAALTPAEAAKPACYRAFTESQEKQGHYSLGGAIEVAGPGDLCRPLVTDNPAYFDLTLPRTTPQILTVDVGRCVAVTGGRLSALPVTRFDAPPQGCVQHARMWQEVDWTKIAALVRQ